MFSSPRLGEEAGDGNRRLGNGDRGESLTILPLYRVRNTGIVSLRSRFRQRSKFVYNMIHAGVHCCCGEKIKSVDSMHGQMGRMKLNGERKKKENYN
jgi:hypothetical protein